ncbi:hypothetical protein [Paeniglutamicibacter antarcticus]|uniref:Flagellin-like protein n=1 Tax=Paeniglutamicibacter antarcticus TaxID=494023 RepID=A0ABP9TQH1_9MICC
MNFNDDARLYSGRNKDSRGRGHRIKIAAGGAIIVVLIAAVLGNKPGILAQLGLGSDAGTKQGTTNNGSAAFSE